MPVPEGVIGKTTEGALTLGSSAELSDRDATELRALKEQIERDSGFVCSGYKDKCLRRRLAVRMRARAVHGYGEYAALLREDAAEYARLHSILTINVSKFFRNLDVWDALRDRVLPGLFGTPDKLRIWSAGAAGGEEPYTLAILLAEYAAANGLTSRLSRVRILATDVDREALGFARKAHYGEFALSETPADVRQRWFSAGPPYRLHNRAQAMVDFQPLDLLREPFPQDQDLIVCRNVVIYFERAAQEKLFERFRAALRPGGFLLLGKVESLFGPGAVGFRPVANRERIFLRV